jgi:hypothetical protein
MHLPFSRAQFFDVFAAYNTAVWPTQIVLACLALAMMAGIVARPAWSGRFVSFGLAALWAWIAIAYHLAFFWPINPAAPLFAAITLATAAIFLFHGLRGSLHFERSRGARAASGWLLIAFALVGYPAVGVLAGHAYPASPTFGLPCPTTLFTVGLLLLAAPDFPRALAIGPLAWSLIGGTAAVLLAVPQDFALFLAAAACLYLLAAPRRPSSP